MRGRDEMYAPSARAPLRDRIAQRLKKAPAASRRCELEYDAV